MPQLPLTCRIRYASQEPLVEPRRAMTAKLTHTVSLFTARAQMLVRGFGLGKEQHNCAELPPLTAVLCRCRPCLPATPLPRPAAGTRLQLRRAARRKVRGLPGPVCD